MLISAFVIYPRGPEGHLGPTQGLRGSFGRYIGDSEAHLVGIWGQGSIWGLSKRLWGPFGTSRGHEASFGVYPGVLEAHLGCIPGPGSGAHLGPIQGAQGPIGGLSRRSEAPFGVYRGGLEAHLGPVHGAWRPIFGHSTDPEAHLGLLYLVLGGEGAGGLFRIHPKTMRPISDLSNSWKANFGPI